MYIKDGIAYAGEESKPIRVSSVRPLENHMLLVRFNTGEVKKVDMKPLLDAPAFVPLKDKKLFDSVYIEYGFPMWFGGDIDIAPEYLHRTGISISSDGVL